ncbi:MAG: N-acetylmuramoyl-L-alanine amidase [Candidatus Korobacteraceae bacterium]
MTGQTYRRAWQHWLTAFSLLCLLAAPAFAASVQVRKQQARSQFENAERMREELNGLPQHERSRREYQRVIDAYRRVYFAAPTSSKADSSVLAVAELLAESGRFFDDEKTLRAAIAQYEFLRREYPGSKYRFDALFTIAQIYKDDLEEPDKARAVFEEVIHRYPHLQLSADAREALAEMDQQARNRQKPSRTAEARSQEAKPFEASTEPPRNSLPLVTGIRHWSTPDYTRVAIDLEQEVKYEAGRIPDPDRIFFDLHDTKLASTLVGKTFEVSDGFLRRVRIAQFQKGMVRVVLEVDDVSDYSAFLLPNPYRLIVDIHGRRPNAPQTLVARAQQQGEQRTPSPPPQELKPATPESSAPPAKSRPDAVPLPSASLPTSPAAKPADGFGPKMADGSFFSHPSAPAVNAKVTSKPSSFASSSASSPVVPAPASKGETSHGATEASSPASSLESTRSEVAELGSPELKATDKPTSQPTVQVVAPRGPEKPSLAAGKKNQRYPEIRQAQPTSEGQRSLIRALGLKVGRIVIDAGHGGHDTGTIGPNGLLEKDLVLDVSLRLGRLLQGKMGAEVIYTRDDDTFVPLETRTAIANQQQADLFISIHANSSQDASALGVETYYLNFNPSPDALEVAARENAVSEKSVHELGDLVKKIALKEKVEESREFAVDVQHSLYQGLAGKEKTMRDRGVKKAPFIVLIGANMPSILAEISFVSNPGDARKLQTPEYRQKIAEALYRGVARYINGLSGVKVVASRAGSGEGQQ